MGVQVFYKGRLVDSSYVAVDSAVSDYDARLYFDVDMTYGDNIVYMKMPHGEAPLPIFNFGRDVPPADVVVQRLKKADAVRRGEEILDDINRNNDRIRAEYESAASKASEETAEIIESFSHREGITRYHRSYPKKDPKQQNKGWK